MTTDLPTKVPPGGEASATLVGQVVSGRYRIRELLGEGGMGAVYLAEHTHMRKRVALKLLHAEMSQDQEVLARFRREAEAAARVEHPNVAAATDFGQIEDGSFFLVLEYVDGTSLRKLLDTGPLPPERALHIARQIALALERAHGAGIVHRDLKPENIMLVTKGADIDFVKVLDFGIAKIEPHPTRDASQPLTKFGTILGTPEYMSPEQALGESVGPGADLYAVGVMLYEMLTAKHPFDAPDRMAVLSMHIVAPVPKMNERNPAIDIAPSIEELVRQLLEKDPKARPPGARALAGAIVIAATQAGVDLPHATSMRNLPRESSPGPPPSNPNPSWSPTDALAHTDYSVPARPPESSPTTARALTGGGGLTRISQLDTLADKLKRLPKPVVLAVGIGTPFVVLLIIVVAIALRSPDAPTTTTIDGGTSTVASAKIVPDTKHAPPEKLRAAVAQGLPALETLEGQYPEDATLAKQLALAFSGAGRDPDALRTVRAAAKLDKDVIDDPVIDLVTACAQKPATADDAFALLEGPLGSRGVDGLLDLSTSKSFPLAIRNRAARSLTKPAVRANASAAAALLIDVKSASRCDARRDWLDRVREAGDARVLATLKAMKNPRGCGFMGMRDCWPCLRRDDALDDTIKAVESRQKVDPRGEVR